VNRPVALRTPQRDIVDALAARDQGVDQRGQLAAGPVAEPRHRRTRDQQTCIGHRPARSSSKLNKLMLSRTLRDRIPKGGLRCGGVVGEEPPMLTATESLLRRVRPLISVPQA
jgi:hypothetical protein